MVENVADTVANVADLMANVVDLMANVAIEKPLSYALSIGICRKPSVSTQETSGFHARNRWFPTWKPMDFRVETNGNLRGDQWRPAWELMETCVNHYAEAPLPVHASADGHCERSVLSGAKAKLERYSQAGNASESKAFFSLLRETLLSVEAGNASESKAFFSTNAKSFVFSCATFQ